jgi:hypothetical protein
MFNACSVFGVRTTEEAPYKTMQKDDSFEIREYSSYVVVEVKDSGEWKQFQEKAFGKLFRYISGANTGEQKISMTAPVIVRSDKSEKISMTSPVFLENAEDGSTMSFVLPSKYTLESAPKPTAEGVVLREQEPQRRLVKRFSGLLNPKSMMQAREELLDYAKANDITIDTNSVVFAGYDPPWTIPWLRRNEAMANIN